MFEHWKAEKKQVSLISWKYKKSNWTWRCSRLLQLCQPPSSTTSYWCQKTKDAEKANPTLLVEPFCCYVVFIRYIKLIAWGFFVWVFLFCFVLHSSAKTLPRNDSHYKEALEFALVKNFGPHICQWLSLLPQEVTAWGYLAGNM